MRRPAAIASQAPSNASFTPACVSGHSLDDTRSTTSVTTPSHTPAQTSRPRLHRAVSLSLRDQALEAEAEVPARSCDFSSSNSPRAADEEQPGDGASCAAPVTSPRASSASFSRGPTLSASASFTSCPAQRAAVRYKLVETVLLAREMTVDRAFRHAGLLAIRGVVVS